MYSAETTDKVPDAKGFVGKQNQVGNFVNYFWRSLCLLYRIIMCDRMILSHRNGIGRVWAVGKKKVRNWRVWSRIARG